MILDNSGLKGLPCGTPFLRLVSLPFIKMGTRNHLRINRNVPDERNCRVTYCFLKAFYSKFVLLKIVYESVVFTILLNALLFQFTNLHAQIDTLFWFAPPWSTPDQTERHNIVVHLSTFSAPSTTVHLWQPAAIAPNKYDTTFQIPANTTYDYIFWRDKIAAGAPSTLTPNMAFDSLETRPANTVVPYGLCVTSSTNITVVYDVTCQPPGYSNPETFSLMGQNGFGLEFVCPQQTLYRNRTLTTDRVNTPIGIIQPKQQIAFVATQPNTVVWITPRCNVVGHPANITYSIMLPSAGSAYNIENTVQDTYNPGNNLSGTILVADKPIAVTVADDAINSIFSNPAAPGVTQVNDLGCFDLIGDQIVPIDVVGKDYIVNRGELFQTAQQNANDPGMKESAFIVATDTLTNLTIVDGTVTTTTTLNKGDTYVDTLQSAFSYVHADKNVYVYHVSGMGCELGSALVPPLTCAGSTVVTFSRNIPQKFTLNILCKNGSQGTFTLNGTTALTPASSFTQVPGTSGLPGGPFWGATIDLNSTSTLPIGSYTIGNNTDVFALGVFEGDYMSGDFYHYSSSFMNHPSVKAGTVPDLCVNSTNTVALTGTISGASSTGIWTTMNGTGTFSQNSFSTIISATYSLSTADTLLSSIKFYLISGGDCLPVLDSTLITINHRPAFTVSAIAPLCKNNLSLVVLSGTVMNAASAVWSGGNGGIYSGSGTAPTYSLSTADLSASAVVFTLTSQTPLSGCSNAAQTLTLNLIDPPIVNSGSNAVVCSKTASSVSLYGSVNGITNTGTWTGNGSGIFLPSANASTVNYALGTSDYSSTSLIFTLTSTNNSLCASVSSMVYVFRDTSSVYINASSGSVCINQSATLTAVGTPVFLWNTGITSPSIVISPQATTVYTVQGTSTLNCNYIETISISVNALPTVSASTSSSLICIGESAILHVSGASSYTWISIPAYTSSVLVSPSLSSVYHVTGTDNNGCTNSDSINVSVSECLGITNYTEDIIQIYPNPSQGEFIIQSIKNVSLKLIDQLGQVVQTIELNAQNQHKICIHDLADGVYFITGNYNDRAVTNKIVIGK